MKKINQSDFQGKQKSKQFSEEVSMWAFGGMILIMLVSMVYSMIQ